ncbi:MAG: hypothetical protein EVB11_00945 [Winogradskyella sp.]|nr:MAG: hypothetical protein EVB11_00945 [Winogradskyella sp.]
MKEEQFKKIIKKSSIETSEDFINNLMESIEIHKKTQKTSFKAIRLVLGIVSVIISCLVFLFIKSDSKENSYWEFMISIPKIPLLVIVTLSLLFGLNYLIRLNEENSIKI